MSIYSRIYYVPEVFCTWILLILITALGESCYSFQFVLQQLKLRHSVAHAACHSHICMTPKSYRFRMTFPFSNIPVSPPLILHMRPMRCRETRGLKLVSGFELDNRSSDSVHPTKPLWIQRWGGGELMKLTLKLKFTWKCKKIYRVHFFEAWNLLIYFLSVTEKKISCDSPSCFFSFSAMNVIFKEFCIWMLATQLSRLHGTGA